MRYGVKESHMVVADGLYEQVLRPAVKLLPLMRVDEKGSEGKGDEGREGNGDAWMIKTGGMEPSQMSTLVHTGPH